MQALLPYYCVALKRFVRVLHVGPVNGGGGRGIRQHLLGQPPPSSSALPPRRWSMAFERRSRLVVDDGKKRKGKRKNCFAIIIYDWGERFVLSRNLYFVEGGGGGSDSL